MLSSGRTGVIARGETAGLAGYKRRYRGLLGELTKIGFISSGSVARRYNHYGKADCACHRGPPRPRGPYFQWAAKVGGKTVNRHPGAREAELRQEWIGNDRRLRALIDELRAVAEQTINLILEAEMNV